MEKGQKAPSAKRCIKTGIPSSKKRETSGQKAPSAKRCIKTSRFPSSHTNAARGVRKHRAPKGALRPTSRPPSWCELRSVRKHRAPNGALRPSYGICSMTLRISPVRKHRAPKGALRHATPRDPAPAFGSESTERQTAHYDGRMTAQAESQSRVRQKAPSAKRCIKTRNQPPRRWHPWPRVRKHRAPKGALRPLTVRDIELS